jgi:ribosomal protein S12 methylthiotransferase
VGAFAFSPEEGTPAAEMEFVDNEVAVKRAELIEMIQSDVMDAYNASFIDKELEILVDGYDEEFEQFYGRTYADSPDIDGRVWLASETPLREGQFVMVHIDGCIEGDLSGYVLED